MARLQYDISVVGMANVDRALRTVEQRTAASIRRTQRLAGTVGATRGARGGRGVAQERASQTAMHSAAERSILRQNQLRQRGIERAARAQDAMHRKQMANIAKQRRAEERAAITAARARQQATRGRVGAIGRSAGNAIRGVGSAGLGLLGIGGAALVGSAVSRRVREGNLAAGIANRAALVPGEKRSRADLLKATESQARALEARSGRSSGTVLGGMDKFLEKTGMFNEMIALAPFLTNFADTMSLADDNFQQLGQTAGIIAAGIKKTNPQMSQQELIAETEKAVLAMGKQSALGQIGVPELAKEMPKLLAAASRQGGNAATNLANMTALANIAVATAASDPSEATTSVMRVTDDLIKGRKKIRRKYGIDVMDERGGLKALGDFLPDLIAATGGNLSELKNVFGVRGIKAVESSAKLVRDAGVDTSTKSGREQAAKMIRAELAPFLTTATPEEVKAGAEFARGTDARRIAKAWQDMERALADEFAPVLMSDILPALKDFAPALKDAAKGIAKVVKFFAGNPTEGLGIIIAGAVVKDIVAAGIGKKLATVIAGQAATAKTAAIPGIGLGGAAAIGAGAIGVGLAVDQAGKLARELGSTRNVGPDFSSPEKFMESLFVPLQRGKKGDLEISKGFVGGGILATMVQGVVEANLPAVRRGLVSPMAIPEIAEGDFSFRQARSGLGGPMRNFAAAIGADKAGPALTADVEATKKLNLEGVTVMKEAGQKQESVAQALGRAANDMSQAAGQLTEAAQSLPREGGGPAGGQPNRGDSPTLPRT